MTKLLMKYRINEKVCGEIEKTQKGYKLVYKVSYEKKLIYTLFQEDFTSLKDAEMCFFEQNYHFHSMFRRINERKFLKNYKNFGLFNNVNLS